MGKIKSDEGKNRKQARRKKRLKEEGEKSKK